MKEFKYKITFASTVRCLIDEEKDKILAKASLDNLKSIIPESVRNQLTLLPVAFNSCTPNLGNKNGAMINTETALDIYKEFINLPINLEHSRSSSIGHVVNASFSEFDINYATGSGSKIIDIATIKDTNEPFNLALAAVLYKLYSPQLCEAIEESNDPNSSKYLEISASWELLYDEFDLAVGSKYLKDCEVITDENKKQEYDKYLLNNGGTGKLPDGKPVYILLKGEVVPGGIGFTSSPAAEVRGVIVDSEKTKISVRASLICPECSEPFDSENDIEDSKDITCSKCKKTNAGKKWKGGKDKENKEEPKHNKNNNSQISDSQLNAGIVNNNTNSENNNIKVMIKTRKDITDEALKEANASQVISVLDAEVERISNEFEAKQNETKTKLADAENKYNELEQKYNQGQEKLTKMEEDLNKLVKANEDREKEEIFNTRMNYFDSEYDLSDEKIRNIVARKIKNANEEEYKEAKEEIELLLAAKKKMKMPTDHTGKSDCTCAVCKSKNSKASEDKQETKASTEKNDNSETVVDDALTNGEKNQTTVAATTAPAETEADKWNDAFGIDNWQIDQRAVRKR